MVIKTPRELELFERYEIAVLALRDLLSAVDSDQRVGRGDYFHERKEARRVLEMARIDEAYRESQPPHQETSP